MSGGRSQVRAVSESTGVATLVVITLVATATVGLGALFLDGEDETEFGAQFTFSHLSERGELLVFYESGENLRAGNIIISGPSGEVTWAQLRGMDANATATPGTREPVRLSSQTAYGSSVTEEHYVEIRYRPTENDDLEEPVVLARWNEQAQEEGGGSNAPGGAPGGGEPGTGPQRIGPVSDRPHA